MMQRRVFSAPGLDSPVSSFGARHQYATTLECGETLHQQLQRGLTERAKGGPHEQQRSAPLRLRNTRSCAIMHSSLEDPLTDYKTLEPMRPRLKFSQRRYHLTDGYKCFDQDTIVVDTRDQLSKTKNGLARSSTGSVTYSDTHRKKLELDAQELTRILAHEGVPGGGYSWTPAKLKRVFMERTGRTGVWSHYEVPFVEFLSAFPKTFCTFNHDEYVQLQKKGKPTVLDTGEDVLIRLARARDHGYVETMHEVQGAKLYHHDLLYRAPSNDAVPAGTLGRACMGVSPPAVLQELQRHRVKAHFQPFSCDGVSTRSPTGWAHGETSFDQTCR